MDAGLPTLPQPGCECGARLRALLRRHRLVIGVIVLVFVSHLVFIALDRRPFTYDDSWYAETALRFLEGWTRGGLAGAYDFFVHQTFSGAKAPLIILLPQPFLLLFGPHDFAFRVSNAVCLIVASAYLAGLARLFVQRASIVGLAVLVFSLMPLTADLTRTFFVEMLLTTLVLMFAYHAVKSEQLTCFRHSLLAGLAFGLGLLCKITFPVFVVGLLVLIVHRVTRQQRDKVALPLLVLLTCLGPLLAVAGPFLLNQATWPAGFVVTAIVLSVLRPRPAPWRRNLAWAVSLALWTPMSWYLPNASTVFGYAYSASVGNISKDYGASDLFSLAAMGDFWLGNINSGAGFVYILSLAVVLVLLVLTSFVRRRNTDERGSSVHALSLVAAWLLPAALVFTLGRNRTMRFILPLLPAAALLYGVLLHVLVERVRSLGGFVGIAHALAAAVVYGVFTFGGPTVGVGPDHRFVLCSPDLAGGSIARGPPYPLDKIVHLAAQLAPPLRTRAALGMLLTDTPQVNQNTLSYAAAKINAPIYFGLVTYGGTYEQALQALSRGDVALYQEHGGYRPPLTNRWGPELLRQTQHGDIAEWLALDSPAIPLPDGGVLRFIERLPLPPADEGQPFQPCLVLYQKGALALTGFSLGWQTDGLRVATCWLKLRPDEGCYAVAAHLINADRSFQKNIDHGPPRGPITFLLQRVGETVIAEHTQPAGDWVGQAQYLALALYDVKAARDVPYQLVSGFEPGDGYWLRVPLPAKAATSGPSTP